ncbi:MAG: DotU family type IV/VI secretion system protein [Proteobacteria bacterium]|nr:DotU family type IV/VI secretion system protein [Pseudomonadota bacterium]
MPLSDCFVDLIAYVAYGMREPDTMPSSCDELARIFDRLIVSSEEKRVVGGYSLEDYDLARFAVLVWIDETIMKSSWTGKGNWQKKLLQKAYYKTSGGGVEFYKKLDALEADQDPVREVYFVCLALGYSGRYGVKAGDQGVRETIKSKHLKRLTGSSNALSEFMGKEKIFPGSYAAGETAQHTGKNKLIHPSWVPLLLGVGPICVFAFLYFLYRFILNNEILTKMVH